MRKHTAAERADIIIGAIRLPMFIAWTIFTVATLPLLIEQSGLPKWVPIFTGPFCGLLGIVISIKLIARGIRGN